ncbi:bifunctional diaminohydroxyphosphoribosylaminopyrimidine deaminase/5-amino-6-(5-phosphoribosylamino)uracil reductase RibD [Tatumella sp. UCD-D_suzukii]|uniref:bifunctional diaminohydroxyphosphoribosylaminopyrimidine deaminase/5-amino-6-(5-phosphoribosylamino)uracil reductase RibD n=1 Tax=Tatumella sp. UCD-D_suzukii TaxID=1408192 RepID=UPI000A5D45B5|nr:bifunctional diaminohydroxyphosphoribosylaminopyrimidine deaminase/5-amino-6-(5-phosphoribosylamino)uracil reductase RibD [Tatumella sp. UCD-D_suzukii]
MSHEAFMLLALAVSEQALPDCLPNPPVGCVIVRDGKVIATDYTHAPGLHHAEMDALSKVSGSLEDCDMYVTLEPCSFTGRTPSCARALVKRNIGRLFVSVIDPHPRNQGKGIDIVRKDVPRVEIGLCASEVSTFLTPYPG